MNNEELKALRQSWYDEARKQTNETIPSFLQKLFEYKHDYDTICYACGAAAVATATASYKKQQTGLFPKPKKN
jgi:cystathionine beta-lyase/cystathionine gamma-synthase